MKGFFYKYTAPLFSLLTALVAAFLLAAALLYTEKSRMQRHNHALILQNDSILSENIRLRNTLQRQKDYNSQTEELTLNK